MRQILVGLFLFLGFSGLAPAALAMGRAPTVLPVVPVPPSQRNYLKVLSLNFNSEAVMLDRKDTLREERLAAMVDWIRRNDVDIILLQEAWNFRGDSSVAKTLARALDYDVHYWIGMGVPGFVYDSNAILAKKQYRMSGRRHHRLVHSACGIGNGKDWTLGLGRVTYALGAKLFLSGGEPLYVYDTHLLGKTEADRLDQIAELNEKIALRLAREGADPARTRVILGGDMNFDARSPGASYLRANSFADTFDQAHPGDPSCTDCADPSVPFFDPITIGSGLVPDQSADHESKRIDFVYSRGTLATLASTLVFTAPFETVWMSDHYGVLSTLGTGELPSNPIPNPTHDSDSGLPAPTVLRVTEDLFRCSRFPCPGDAPLLDVRGPRGLVVVNELGGELQVELRGPGSVVTKREATLSPRHSAAFAFDTDGDFSIELRTYRGGWRFGSVHVRDAEQSINRKS